jgi:hypothetical protein
MHCSSDSATASATNLPPEELQRIKRVHEERVARCGGPSLPEFRLQGRERPLRLTLVNSGDALVDIVGASSSFSYERPDRLAPVEREIIGRFFQSCQDCGDIYSDIGPKGHLDAGQDLQDLLDELRGEPVPPVGAR